MIFHVSLGMRRRVIEMMSGILIMIIVIKVIIELMVVIDKVLKMFVEVEFGIRIPPPLPLLLR